MSKPAPERLAQLKATIKSLGPRFGFQKVAISGLDLSEDEARLGAWLARGRHGEMHYMEKHGIKRSRPASLVPDTLSVISVRMDYWPGAATDAHEVLHDRQQAYVARYALGRDYHKVMRRRLKRLAQAVARDVGEFGYRVFVDSAPVLERALGRNAGLGWVGKHTNLIDREAGSWFFLGEIYTDLPLPPDAPVSGHCGTCTACIDVCPTQAIVAPYELDARRCISYLTIEQRGSIPVPLRPLVGNRIFGCDDCQLVCPWNRYASVTTESDFAPRHGLDSSGLVELFAWTEDEWRRKTEGSALRRAGFLGWLRNIAVALGNAPRSRRVIRALEARAGHDSELVAEHVGWAVLRQIDDRP
jgi:epoxyqueuosine reductase